MNMPGSEARPLSTAVVRQAGKFLVVIDHVLALNYLKPELRRRVVKLQRQLIKAEMSAHYQVREE